MGPLFFNLTQPNDSEKLMIHEKTLCVSLLAEFLNGSI